MTNEERNNAVGLARYAYDYIDAAMVVDREIGASEEYCFRSPTPAYFLAIHGIELTLKAFLLHNGVSARDLRDTKKYGHDIRACYRKAKELGLDEIFKETLDDMKAMRLLIDLNEQMGLRYIRTGLKEFPSWAIVEPFAIRLHQAVAPSVGYKTFSMGFVPAVST